MKKQPKINYVKISKKSAGFGCTPLSGEEVSKDYEKLLRILHLTDKYKLIFGYGQDTVTTPCRTTYIISNDEDNIQIDEFNCDSVKSKDFDNDTEALSYFNSINLSFIDPNPPNPNAIFYADGSEVKVGDKFEFNGYGVTVVRRGTVALLHGTLGYHIDKFKRCFVSFAERVFIIWDNNRMTNVEKVVV